MKIQKQIHNGSKKRKKGKKNAPYVCFRPYDKALFLNCKVRDAILPHKYVEIEILDALDFVIYPSDNETEYKVSIRAGGNTSISGSSFANNYKLGIHISAEVREDGTILCKANEGGAVVEAIELIKDAAIESAVVPTGEPVPGLQNIKNQYATAGELADLLSGPCPPFAESAGPVSCSATSCRDCWLSWITTGKPKNSGKED